MTRRFQFSLRALLIVTALVALPLGVYHWLLNYSSTATVGPATVGTPVKFQARLFYPAEIQDGEISFRVWPCFHRAWRGRPYISTYKACRSWLVFLEADAEMTFHEPGDYELRIMRIDRESLDMEDLPELAQIFTVKPAN